MKEISPANFQNICFWGEVAPCDHLLHLYEDDRSFSETLSGFVAGGLLAGEAAVVIATPNRSASLERRLGEYGIDVTALAASDQYIALDAEATLGRFMVDDWPNEARFNEVVGGLRGRALANRPHVRMFGEMVALLWAKGSYAATVRLEQLWHKHCHLARFSLMCAYPKSGFQNGTDRPIKDIHAAHSRSVSN